MATRKITAATAITASSVASGDQYPIVDVSDTTDASTGTTKHITSDNVADSIGAYPTGTKVYRALLTQSSTSAPVATVLQNTLGGTVVWGYSSTGIYTATLAGVFLSGKVFGSSGFGANGGFRSARQSDDIVQLSTRNYAGTLADAILSNDTLTIIVFP